MNTTSHRSRKLTRRLTGILAVAMTAPPALAQGWQEVTPAGGPPPARIGGVMVYNPFTNRMIVFGGCNNASCAVGIELNDVWVLSNADGTGAATPVWTQLAPTGPPPSPRCLPGFGPSYDPVSNRLIVFGGNTNVGGGGGLLNDVWVLSNADGTEASPPAWTQLLPTGGPPAATANLPVVYDRATNRLILFGGESVTNDVWALTNANGLGGAPQWIQLIPNGAPGSPAAGNMDVAYDPSTNRMILSRTDPAGSLETWVLENANGVGGSPTWTQLFPTGGPPGIRLSHTAVYDPSTNRQILFAGGVGLGAALLNDVWVLENANGLGGTPNWVQLNPAPDPATNGTPLARRFHHAVYNSATNRMMVFGGETCPTPCNNCDQVIVLNDVWVLRRANGLTTCAGDVNGDGTVGIVDFLLLLAGWGACP